MLDMLEQGYQTLKFLYINIGLTAKPLSWLKLSVGFICSASFTFLLTQSSSCWWAWAATTESSVCPFVRCFLCSFL